MEELAASTDGENGEDGLGDEDKWKGLKVLISYLYSIEKRYDACGLKKSWFSYLPCWH